MLRLPHSPFLYRQAQSHPASYLRREFDLHTGIVSVWLHLTAPGVIEAYLNGQRVGEQVLTPGWTAYDQRLRYQIFDVTALLKPGRNTIGALLGDGWFRGRLGFGGGRRNIWGERLALLAQLEIRSADGALETYGSDGDWV